MGQSRQDGTWNATRVGLVVAAAMLAFTPMARAADVLVVVEDGTAKQVYTVAASSHMSALDAVEIALPAAPGGAFTLVYYPPFAGYQVQAIGRFPVTGANDYWSTCLLPSAPNSTVISLPLALNRIMVSGGDTLSLVHNAACSGVDPSH